jgi:hypothetical protein
VRGRQQLGGGRAERYGNTLGRDVLLDGDRQTVQRALGAIGTPAFLGLLRLAARALEVGRIERLEAGLPGLDAVDDRGGHLDGRKFPGPVGGQQLDGAEIMEGGHWTTLNVPQ